MGILIINGPNAGGENCFLAIMQSLLPSLFCAIFCVYSATTMVEIPLITLTSTGWSDTPP